MELELYGWKVKAALLALIVLVVAIPLLRAVHANKVRAEGWHHRAVIAEESVSGLRVVIAERSRALNERTVQANQLSSKAQSRGKALRQTQVSVGTLTRRQRRLSGENARLTQQQQALQTRLETLGSIALRLGACAKATVKAPAASPAKRTANNRARLANCASASTALDTYLRRSD